jgi:hypothetical protein
MQTGTKEFMEIVKDFEMMASKTRFRVRFDKEHVAPFEKPKFNRFYSHGETQLAFEMFVNGYSAGRAVYMEATR